MFEQDEAFIHCNANTYNISPGDIMIINSNENVVTPGRARASTFLHTYKLGQVRMTLKSLCTDMFLTHKKRPESLKLSSLIYIKLFGAGEGNRTLVSCLGSKRSTIELRPHMRYTDLTSLT